MEERKGTEAGAPPDRPGSWYITDLSRFSRLEQEALIDLPGAWYQHRELKIPSGCDVELLWKYIDAHGLGGAAGHLAVSGLIGSEELSEHARHRYFSNILHHERARKVCCTIGARSRELNIPCVLMKGPILTKQAYEDPGVRAFGDIDLYVRTEDEANRLLDALEGRSTDRREATTFLKRMREPGKFKAEVDSFEVEASFLTKFLTDPILEFFARNKEKVYRVATEDECLESPDVGMHLVLLLLHMGVNHFCSRFIWFLDLAALIRKNRSAFDFDWVEHELGQLEMKNFAASVLDSCRKNIDPAIEFPIAFEKNWNSTFLYRMNHPLVVARSPFGFYHSTLSGFLYGTMAYAFIFYLFSDSGLKWLGLKNSVTRWTTTRFLHGLRLSNRFLNLLFLPLVFITIWPMSIVASRIFLRGRIEKAEAREVSPEKQKVNMRVKKN